MQNIITSLLALGTLAAAGPLKRDAAPGGCSDISTHNFAWAVNGFDYHASYTFTTPAHQNSWGYVDFNLTNPSFPYTIPCSATSNQLEDFFYGTVPYTCRVPEGAPVGAGNATFSFSRPTGQLNINQTWTCSDADPQYPTTFHGFGSVNLTLECTDTTWQNPNWTTPGDIYSSRNVDCTPVDFFLAPYQITAVA